MIHVVGAPISTAVGGDDMGERDDVIAHVTGRPDHAAVSGVAITLSEDTAPSNLMLFLLVVGMLG
jgi:hypothetical protein